jgi:hypothetical protein
MSLKSRLAVLEQRVTPPDNRQAQVEELVVGFRNLEERAKQEPWLQPHLDLLLDLVASLPARRQI